MKYVLMFTNRPDLDAAVDPERAQAVYEKIYEWFEENGAGSPTRGAELHRRETATTVKHGDDGAGRRRRPVQRGQGGHRRLQRHRRPRPGRRDRADQDLAARSSSPASPSRSARWSRTTASSSDDAEQRPPRTASSRAPCARRPACWWPPVAPVRRLRRRRGGGAGRGRRGADVLAPRRAARPARRLAADGRHAATRSTCCGTRDRQDALASAGRRAAHDGQRRTAPTTGSRCCSPAATRRSAPRPGWR